MMSEKRKQQIFFGVMHEHNFNDVILSNMPDANKVLMSIFEVIDEKESNIFKMDELTLYQNKKYRQEATRGMDYLIKKGYVKELKDDLRSLYGKRYELI